MPRGRLLEYCVDSRHLEAHRAITSSSCATFKFRLFLGPPSYLVNKQTAFLETWYTNLQSFPQQNAIYFHILRKE
jgi:hypothetical protein